MREAGRPELDEDPYETLKERARARNAALSVAGRDIGALPEVVDPVRKREAAENFRLFCESYFPQTFHLEWSDDHHKVIAKMERAVLHGGLFAMAMPRGSGKTTICECACIWAVLYGHREFVCLIGSDEGHATDMLDSIKTEFEGNDLLLEDFPEVAHPIQALDGIANRCSGQLYQGQRTHITWTAREIVLPTIPGSAASGAIIKSAGLTGRIRGMKFKRADGQSVRPRLVILDDPQTDESARSLSQCATREHILAGAVLGLAGPGEKISGIMPCTVIRPGDMADNILDRDKHPEWNGERTRMVYAFPTDEKRWARYAELRADGLRQGDGGKAATEFYREHRTEMDAGARVAWEARYNHDELSAIQHAMNLKLQDEGAFFAEYQNEPLVETVAGNTKADADDVLAKVTPGLQQGQIPIQCRWVTAFIDVSDEMLWYAVAAVEEDFMSYLIDWGMWPQTSHRYPTKAQAKRSLYLSEAFFHEYPHERTRDNQQKAPFEAKIYFGLESLLRTIDGYEFLREDDAPIELYGAIDANWGQSTDTVRRVIRETGYRNWLPSHGRGITAVSKPMSDYKIKAGGFAGEEWTVSVGENSGCWQLLYDTNYWKTHTHARILSPPGTSGSLSVCDHRPDNLELLSHHVGGSEYPTSMTAKGRTCDVWQPYADDTDNDLFDCVVGCLVLASTRGAKVKSQEDENLQRERRRRPSMREMYENRIRL